MTCFDAQDAGTAPEKFEKFEKFDAQFAYFYFAYCIANSAPNLSVYLATVADSDQVTTRAESAALAGVWYMYVPGKSAITRQTQQLSLYPTR